MKDRFKVADWVSTHDFQYTHWKRLPLKELQRIKHGLARFHSGKPVVSIVIPVWNEEKNIIRTLSSFSEMELPFPAELIFVDNNSKDDTPQILKYMNVTTIWEGKQGIAHARLAGLNASRGTYQLCGDGDSLYPPTWIKKMTAPLLRDEKITCVYGNYSFLPFGTIGRVKLGLYELMAESMFEFRRIKREFLNVRGANFGFRIAQGIAVRGFEMNATRVFDNDENSKSYVVFGEDGRMGRKLGELGKLHLVRSKKARIWTSSRRLLKDGNLFHAFRKRIANESRWFIDYAFGPAKVQHTTDTMINKIEQ